MDPVCGGRKGALSALVPSYVSHVRRTPINLLDYSKVLLEYCIIIVVNAVYLSSCYLYSNYSFCL